MKYTIGQIQAIRKTYELCLGEIAPREPGIYLGTRKGDNGITYGYVGKAKDLLHRRVDYELVLHHISYPKRRFEKSLLSHNDGKYRIIEKCAFDLLDEREKYWIDYYKKQPYHETRNEMLTGGRDIVQSNYRRIEQIKKSQEKEIKKCFEYLDYTLKDDLLVIRLKPTKNGAPQAISKKYFDKLVEILKLSV